MRASKVVLYIFLLCCSALLKAQQLKIPFYDDFSKNGLITPDSAIWMPSGVTLNNSYAINPPTQFVATFDGRNALGFPYDDTNTSSIGTTDSLISKPIDLSLKTAKDSLVFSFFWQAKGLGELPDSEEDALVVKFKTIDNEWVTVWSKGSNIVALNNFSQELLEVKDPKYFHKNFQFAFITVGRQSGPFDTWHIDYVYFDEKRKVSNKFYADVAIQDIPTSLLKNYRAMPLHQYLVNPANEINDSLIVRTNDMRATLGPLVDSQWKIFDSVTKENYFFENGVFKGDSIVILPSKKAQIIPKAKSKVSYGKRILSADDQKPFVLGVDKNNGLLIDSLLLTRNDSLYNTISLEDYYAYDDGTAEVGAEVDLKLGKIAVQFILNKADTLGALRFNFSPYFTSKSGTDFLIQIFDSKKGKPNTVLLNQAAKVQYPAKLNDFVEYQLSQNIAVKDTFYVSWTRLSDQTVAVGFDKNSAQFSNRIFYNLGQEWLSNFNVSGVAKVNGSFMVRPVMGAKKIDGKPIPETPLANEIPINQEFIVYPNPTNFQIKWDLVGEYDVKVFTETGKEMLSKRTNQGFIDVSNLQGGIYILHLQNELQSFNKKIVIQK